MDITVIETATRKSIPGKILPASLSDMPIKQKSWKFSWKQLHKIEGSRIAKLCLEEDSREIQGLIMLTLMNQEMLYMNNIEVAPHNYGKNGKYENVAGNLIAYGCLQSFELGKGNYEGFLAFESKTELIPFYQTRYGARHATGQRMFFEPKAGRKLMKKYLKVSFNK